MAVKKIYDNIHSLGPEDVTPRDPDRRPDWAETDPEALTYIRNKPGETTETTPEETTEATPEANAVNSVDLSKMTKLQLENYAAENGIDGVDSSMTKADMINVIEQW